MGRRRKIKCSKCGKALFYMPIGYDMAFSITCIECDGDGESKKKANAPRTAAANFARTKKGPRPDIHPMYSFRSSTEANIARIFEHSKTEWKYEEKVFIFPDRKIRPFQYIPDFEIVKGSKQFPAGWYEVKGWMDSESRNKLRLFKQKYPEEAARMTIVLYRSGEKKNIEFCQSLGYRIMYFDQLTKDFAPLIPTWEG
jgi:hypothetical protein